MAKFKAKRKDIFLAGGILLFLVGVAFWSSASERNLCRGNIQPIPFKRLSDEERFPFFRNGRPLSYWKNKIPYYSDYHTAVARFPDVRACLITTEREEKAPNLALFDWDVIESKVDAEVCVFRVFSSIGSDEGAKKWLESQGFEVVYSRENSFQAHWYIEKCGQKFHTNYGFGLLDPLLGSNNTLSVSGGFTTNGEVNGVDVGSNSK